MTGLDIYKPSADFEIPTPPVDARWNGSIRICQKAVVTPELSRPAGVFFHVLKQDSGLAPDFPDTTQLQCLFLDYQVTRQKWDGGRKVCESFDLVNPQQPIYSALCATCPFCETRKSPGMSNDVLCKEQGSLLIMLKDMNEPDEIKSWKPYFLRLSKSGRYVADRWIQDVINSYLIRELQIAPWAFVTVIKTKAKKNQKGGGEYYEPVFPTADFYKEQIEDLKAGKLVSPELFRAASEIREQVRPFLHATPQQAIVTESRPELSADAGSILFGNNE